jgi:hypothetical protein
VDLDTPEYKKIPRKERTAIGRRLVASPAPVVEEFSDKTESVIDFVDPLLFDVFNAASEYLTVTCHSKLHG